ncbi:MAG: acetamidase/formamidase family protein [Thermomicrobiales bacterium]|nr:acetamidase/formamidase family protein [Thermomicrobiales bacterium]
MVTVTSQPPELAFRRKAVPRARVQPGARVRFATNDDSYADLWGEDIDAVRVDFRRLNALSGPIWVEGAKPGDALGFEIESIEIGPRAFAVYVARWRHRMFGVEDSEVVEVEVDGDRLQLGNGSGLAIRPMVGCIGVAPNAGEVSSLAPTSPTGGNMDLTEIAAGATVWFPVQVEGGLLSLGDLHARMGRGEPVGSGLECGGTVTGRVLLASGRAIGGPVIRSATRIGFVGTSDQDWHDAEATAVRAAWTWLTQECSLPRRDAIVVSAALLDVETGGPAGNNVVASLPIAELVELGVDPRTWPMGDALTEPG